MEVHNRGLHKWLLDRDDEGKNRVEQKRSYSLYVAIVWTKLQPWVESPITRVSCFMTRSSWGRKWNVNTTAKGDSTKQFASTIVLNCLNHNSLSEAIQTLTIISREIEQRRYIGYTAGKGIHTRVDFKFKCIRSTTRNELNRMLRTRFVPIGGRYQLKHIDQTTIKTFSEIPCCKNPQQVSKSTKIQTQMWQSRPCTNPEEPSN